MFLTTCQKVERQRVRPRSAKCEVQILGRSNSIQYCQRLAIAAAFFQKAVLLGLNAAEIAHKLITRFFTACVKNI